MEDLERKLTPISKNFYREEFACKCGCGFDTVDVRLIEVLQDIRDYFGKRVWITSGCRCEEHNKKSGGWPSSQHMLGKAADFVVSDVGALQVQAYLKQKYKDELGIGCYQHWTHVDSRNYRAKWLG